MLWIFLACLITVAAVGGMLADRKIRQRKAGRALQIHSFGGIAEDGFVKIGGIEQWIGIRGENRENPVLLVIHGGPGSSYSIFTPRIRSWERHFTIVQWDQRGSGKTYGRTGAVGSGTLTMDRLTRDGIEVAEHVCARLHKEKVILLASSFGSTFGLSMARQRPDLFSAYAGTDQNTGMIRGREANHKATIERLRELGLTKGVATLERMGPDPTKWSAKDFTTAARWTMKSDRRSYDQAIRLLKSAIWFSPSHTLLDIKRFISSMQFSLDRLFPEIPAYDAWEQGTEFEIPFFIFQGANDVVTPIGQARAFFDDVTAPEKGFAVIPDAGHFAAFVQPDVFLSELLARVRPVAVAHRRPAEQTL